MSALALLAVDVGDVIAFLVGTAFILFAVLGQLVNKFKEIQKGPKGGPDPRPAAPRKANPLEDEIGDFLRGAAERRRGGRPQQAGQPQAARPVRQRPVAKPRTAAPAQEPVEVEVVDSERGGLRERLEAKKPRQVGSNLGRKATSAGDTMTGHLHDVFDHRLGNLQGRPGDAASRVGVAEAGSPDDQITPFPSTAAAGLAAIFANADTVRQAILINAVLERPEHRWS